MDLSTDLSDKELELLKLTPAAYLGSCRYKLPADLDSEVYPAIFDNFREMNIGYFLYVGGNDSMDTVDKLSRYAEKIGSDVKFIGIPKTIDNDLVLTTTHRLRKRRKVCCLHRPRDRPRRLRLSAEIRHHRRDHGTPRRMAHRCFQACKKI